MSGNNDGNGNSNNGSAGVNNNNNNVSSDGSGRVPFERQMQLQRRGNEGPANSLEPVAQRPSPGPTQALRQGAVSC